MSDTNFIKPSEHVFVCGGTGSGKSVLADVFTAGMPETVIKIDIKDDTLRIGKILYNSNNYDKFGIFEIGTIIDDNKSKRHLNILLCDSMNEEANLYYHLNQLVY